MPKVHKTVKDGAFKGQCYFIYTKLVSTLKALHLHPRVSPLASWVELALAMQELCRVLMAAVGQGY